MARTEALIDLVLNNVNATKELDKVQKELDRVQKRLDKIEKKAIINFDTREIDKVEKRLDEIKRKSAINLDIRVINLERTFKTIKQVETAVASLSGQMRSLSAPGSGDLGDQLRVAANSANKFFDSLSKGNKYLANTTAGLTEQARAFASLAANINSADKRFIDYIQGAQAAQDKNLKPLFRQFEALRRLYQEGLTGQGAEITSREMGLGMFEALKKEVPNTEAALRSFYEELLRVRNLVESRSTAAFGVESQLIEIEEQLLRIEQERLEVRSALNRELSSPVQGSLARMEGGGRNPFGIPDAQVNAALDARAEAYSKQVDEVQNLKRALAGMEGASRDPFNISDQQINEGLEERARLYLKQVKDLDALGSALEQASSKKYNPFGIADEQINAALNERATLYVKQSQEIRSLMSVLEQASGKKYDPFNISDEQINAGLNERANLYAKQAEEMQALARSLEDMERAARDPFGISDQQINAGLDARAQAFARQAQEMESLMRVLAGMEGAAVDPFNISDQQINAGLEERANLYSRQVVEIQALQNALQQASGKRYDPLGIADEQINAGLNERASLFVTQSKQLDEVQKALAGMEGRRVDPFGISDQQINAGLEQRASVYETQRKEIAALEEALGKMESRKVDWASALGIDAADVAAERARELTRQWEATQKSLKGFDKSFENFQDSLKQSRTFFENVSPAEAIDKIVREFNQGVLAGPESGGGAATAKNIIDTFSSSMKAGGGKVVSAASSVFNQVTQAINFAFGIASPSRFMIELVQNLANTYVSQLQKEYPRIKSATEKAFGQLEPRRPVKELEATFRGFETVDRSSTGFRPLANRAFDPSGAGGEMDEMFRRFRNQIAQLTTQPEIYRNILNALPSSLLTTDLAAAASRRAAASELPSFMPIQRQLGPGELEKAIQSQFAEYLRGIKIPNPWIGPIGDYRNFIAVITGETSKLSSLPRKSQLALPAGRERLALPPGADFQTIAESRIAKALERSAQRGAAVFAEDLERSARRALGGGAGGGVPPSPPTPPGGAPDDFNDRFAAASQQGVQGLLGLAELRDPSKVATARLEILSRVLQEVYSQLDPVAPGAKQLNKELRETIGTLNNLQASRAPDADLLVRLTKNPRLAAGISEGLIGGAFPLLFGQGLGASVGGGLGGFAGGAAGGALGFGLSLIGTAIGSAVDTTVNNLKALASSLKEPTAALEAMKTAGLKVDSGLEDVVNRLEGAGNIAAAQALVFDDLESKIGKLGVIRLQELTDAQKKLESEWSRLNAIIASGLIPYAIQATSAIADLTGWIANLFSLEAPEWLRNIPAGAGGETTWQMRQQEIRKQEQQKERRGLSLPPLTPEGQRKQQLEPFQATVAALSAGLEASDIAKKYTDVIKTAAEEQKDLDNQRFELIESYEESIADIRKNVEQRITQERLAAIAKENELFAAQGDIRLQQLRNANAELRTTVFGNEIGQQLVDAVSEFTEKQLSTENEVANRRRSLELELESKRIEIEQYRIDVAKQVSDLNLSTQKQVEKINDGILKKNQAYDRSRFEIEKRININNLEIKRLEAKQQENLFRGAANSGDPAIAKRNREMADLYANQAAFIEAQKNAVKNFGPPPELSFGSVSAGASVSTAGLDALSARARQLATAIASVQNELSSLASSGDFIGFNARLKEIADQGVTGLVNQFEQLKGQLSNDPLGAQFAKIKEGFEAVAKAPEIAPYKELVFEYQKLAEANVKLGASLEFFLEKGGQQSSQLDSLRVEINSAISGTTELEKAMMDLAQRGISPASEEFKILADNAARIDALQQKLQIINNFKTASSELTLSLRGLVEGFYELGSASEAVKRVGEELGRKSLGFVLDIAFKPVEQAMQKTMFDLAERLGFDIKPEQLQQLEEIKATRLLVAGILEQITKISGTGAISTPGPAAGMAPELARAYQNLSLADAAISQQEAVLRSGGAPNLDVALMLRGEIIRALGTTMISPPEDLINKMKEQVGRMDALMRSASGFQQNIPTSPANQIVPGPGSLPQSQKVDYWDPAWGPVPLDRRPRVGQQVGPQSSLPGAFTGIGGPDLVLPLGSSTPRPTPLEVRPEATQQVEQLNGSLRRLGQTAFDGSQNIGLSAESLKLVNEYSMDSFNKATESLQQGTPKLDTATAAWGKSLGQVVTGLSLAASSVIGIVGGIQNIQKGGAGNVLSGIGSILTTVGSIGMSVAGFMKPGIPGGGGFGAPAGLDFLGGGSGLPSSFRLANGGVLDENNELIKFANGGIVQSPTLFSFEDAGVTRTGQAGEAGAEAIMPLKRTKDGRLGVEADLSVPFEASDALEMGLNDGDDNPRPVDLSVPFQKPQGRMSAAQMMQIAAESGLAIPFAKDQGVALGGGRVDGGDDTIKFESVIINNQEFVTRKEAEEIGRKAEARGASRGAQLAQKGIKNNPRVRASLGIK